ncbi:MAG: choice-of-anchor R domain-containing protein [Terriglobales bacterium]
MKKTIAISVSCLALILLATITLVASGRNKFAFSPDLRTVRANDLPSHITPAPAIDEGLTVIAGNFSSYPQATYFSIFGNTIDQGVNGYPFLIWQGEAFIPTADATVKQIQVGVGDLDSGYGSIEVSLYDDANGVPGTALKSVSVKNVQPYGECCGPTTAKLGAGVPVTAGTQYWVVVSTTARDTDIYGWNFNTTNMTAQLSAAYCVSTTYCSDSGVWVPYQYTQNAFQVLGK